MAHRLGLKPSWFQDGQYPHYDLTANKRAAALRLGAQEITAREWIQRQRKIAQILEEAVRIGKGEAEP